MTMIGDKVKVTSTMDPELVQWIDNNIKSRRFASRSHALEFAVGELMESEKRANENSSEDPHKGIAAI